MKREQIKKCLSRFCAGVSGTMLLHNSTKYFVGIDMNRVLGRCIGLFHQSHMRLPLLYRSVLAYSFPTPGVKSQYCAFNGTVVTTMLGHLSVSYFTKSKRSTFYLA